MTTSIAYVCIDFIQRRMLNSQTQSVVIENTRLNFW